MSINDIIIEEYGIDDQTIHYHKQQFELIGQVSILQHPYLKELHEDSDMYLSGDCYFCDSHNEYNLMCVFSRTGKQVHSVCERCVFIHNFINFNL